MSKPLKIPPSKKFPGLFVHCTACDALVTDTCKKHKQPLEKCKEGKTRYKAVIHVPGTAKKIRSRTFETRDYDEAVQLTLDFKAEVQGNSGAQSGHVAHAEAFRKIITEYEKRDELLIDLLDRHIAILSDDPQYVLGFKKKNLSKGHIEDCNRTYLRFVAALKARGLAPDKLTMREITDKHVGAYYDYLKEDLRVGSAGFNRAITNMVSFFNFAIEEGCATQNPFEQVTREATDRNIDTIEEEDFRALIALMHKPELGMRTYASGKRKSMWREYLPTAIEYILYVGRRRTECVMSTWDNVMYDSTGAPECIRIPDLKINNRKKLPREKWIYRYVPMTDELRDLLVRMGEAKYKGTSKYIIAPEETMAREGIASLLSKAFNHYYEILHPEKDKDLSLGCLRRTNFSGLAAEVGISNAQTISGHTDVATLKRHYVSQEVLAKASKFSVFKKGRAERLNKSRRRNEHEDRSRE